MHDIRSVTKSITSTLVGVALQRHMIPSLDMPLDALLPNVRAPAQQQVRLRDALTMRAGFD